MWKRYADTTICYAKVNSTNLMLTALNSFHNNIKFTIEIEKGSGIPFLDILVIKTPNRMYTSVYHKKTNSDLYIHWNSFDQNKWKLGTIKTLVHRAYDICSTDQYLEIELKHTLSSFNEINGCPHCDMHRVFKEIKEKQLNQQNIAQKPDEDDKKVCFLILPYNGLKGKHVINTMRKQLNTK